MLHCRRNCHLDRHEYNVKERKKTCVSRTRGANKQRLIAGRYRGVCHPWTINKHAFNWDKCETIERIKHERLRLNLSLFARFLQHFAATVSQLVQHLHICWHN